MMFEDLLKNQPLASYTLKFDCPFTVRRLRDKLVCKCLRVKSVLIDMIKSEIAFWLSMHFPQRASNGCVWFHVTKGWCKGESSAKTHWRWDDERKGCSDQEIQMNDGVNHSSSEVWNIWNLLGQILWFIGSFGHSYKDQMHLNFEGVLKRFTELAVHFATFNAVSILTLSACKCIFLFQWGKALVLVYFVCFFL